MSSHQRRHHGRPPPAPDPRRRTSSPPQATYDYDELYELQRQTASLNARLAAFTDRSYPKIAENPRSCSNHHFQDPPTLVTQSPAQHQPTYRKKRNPLRKGSKHRFYTVKNGINGNEVYFSWHQAAPYCWSNEAQYFYKGTICKGFDTYDTV